MKIQKRAIVIALMSALVAALPVAAHQDAPDPNSISTAKPEYSPYLGYQHPDRVYFGDTHLHTSYSTDAGLFGTRLGPDEAYRFAKGEEITSSTGTRARLARPLDFLVVADHAENLGLAPMVAESNPDLLRTEFGRKIHDLVKAGDPGKAYALWGGTVSSGKDALAGQDALVRSMWERLTAAAELHNQPGKFTALIGFEWTSTPGGSNLHRNVVLRDDKSKADQVLPISSFDSTNPEDLWKWMAAYEQKTGGRALAIPHNGNLSNGLMFDDVTLGSKKPLDRAYALQRMRWEPLYEVTQMKGDGETHPSLSPNDEFAAFERWDRGSFGAAKEPGMLPREYAREAYKRGLQYEEKLGANPFKFGMVGSTDAHTGLATTTEDNFFGKISAVEPGTPQRFGEKVTGYLPDPKGRDYTIRHYQASASGLAAVWAKDNTRQALWDAMSRKEVYATTGTRMTVRVFGGWNFRPDEIDRPDFAKQGYERGVPMGGDLSAAPEGQAPSFVMRALRDPDGANLDRIQIVKGWMSKDGKLHEQVHDIAWSGERKPDPASGKLPPVGNTVNVAEASYSNSIGAPMLFGYWKDPAFNPAERAFYYVRVLEIPTPRWTTYDAKFFKLELPKEVPASIQERAYTSPIWYTPVKHKG